MKTIHYIDYMTMAMLKRLAPDAYASLMAHYTFEGEHMLSDGDIVVFEGHRTVNDDGTYGPHNVGKVCSTIHYGKNSTTAEVMSILVLHITSYAYTYGAKHFVTPQMARLWGVTDPFILNNLEIN